MEGRSSVCVFACVCAVCGGTSTEAELMNGHVSAHIHPSLYSPLNYLPLCDASVNFCIQLSVVSATL